MADVDRHPDLHGFRDRGAESTPLRTKVGSPLADAKCQGSESHVVRVLWGLRALPDPVAGQIQLCRPSLHFCHWLSPLLRRTGREGAGRDLLRLPHLPWTESRLSGPGRIECRRARPLCSQCQATLRVFTNPQKPTRHPRGQPRPQAQTQQTTPPPAHHVTRRVDCPQCPQRDRHLAEAGIGLGAFPLVPRQDPL